MAQNAQEIKEKIILFLQTNGPSIPVHISQSVGQSILFTSAFLSELLSEKQIKSSNMRVGSSPIYFLIGQEPQLEKFSNYLKSKEKEAFLLLKEKKFLKDSEQEPAIRVALREIKDFAVPSQNEEEIIWRYFIEPAEIIKEEKKKKIPEEKEMEIFDSKKKTEESKPKKSEKRISKSKSSESAQNKFFNKVKDFLMEKNIEILNIEEIAINKIIFKVREQESEYLIIAFNKKRINEEDISKAYKKSEELNLPYKILSLGTPLKKIEKLINAAKTLKSIEKIE